MAGWGCWAGAMALAAWSCAAAAGEARAQPPALAVDLELVIASDVSTSMDRTEKRLQLGGFVAAFRDPEVLRAIRRGRLGRIAVTYVEWGGEGRQRVVLPWTLLDGEASAAAFAARLEATSPGRLTFGTSMGEALSFAAGLFGAAYAGERRVVDVSGDGESNRGRPLATVRAELLARGITINGLPLVYDRGDAADPDLVGYEPEELVRYFADEVAGGPGSFVVPVRSVDEFPAAVRHKLMREIAGPARDERDFAGLDAP